MKKKVTLFCMTEKGYRVLEALALNFQQVIECVVTSRDPSIEKDYYNEIVAFCKENDIRVHDRKTLKTVNSNYAFAISWRWLIDSSTTTLIVFHDSLLPKYRGFSPLISALTNGDKKIGVTALFATEKYDCGDIIAQSSSPVNYPIKIQRAIELLVKNYTDLAIEITQKIVKETALHGVKQDETKASYSLWRDEKDYYIDWEQDAERIKRFTDAVSYPYKGSLTIIEGKKARILEAEVVENVHIENRTPGKIIFFKQNKPVAVCRKGLLRIVDIVDDETGESLLPFHKFRLRLE
jgi:methionyl-tRNA formyltransferase